MLSNNKRSNKKNEKEEKAETILKEYLENIVYLLKIVEEHTPRVRTGFSHEVKTYEFTSFSLGIPSKNLK